MSWEPLYAPVDQKRFPYGTFFTNEIGIQVAQDTYGEFFLTSRGTVNVDLNKLYEIYGYEEQDQLVQRLINDFDRIVAPLLPLEMVFDGITLRLDFWLEESPEVLKVQDITSAISRPFIFQPVSEKITQQTTVHQSENVDSFIGTTDTCYHN